MDKENHDLLIKIATDVEWLRESFKELKGDVEDLKSFKFKVIGASLVVAFVVSVVANVWWF